MKDTVRIRLDYEDARFEADISLIEALKIVFDLKKIEVLSKEEQGIFKNAKEPKPQPEQRLCEGTTHVYGEIQPCRRRAKRDSDFCWQHEESTEEDGEEYLEELKQEVGPDRDNKQRVDFRTLPNHAKKFIRETLEEAIIEQYTTNQMREVYDKLVLMYNVTKYSLKSEKRSLAKGLIHGDDEKHMNRWREEYDPKIAQTPGDDYPFDDFPNPAEADLQEEDEVI